MARKKADAAAALDALLAAGDYRGAREEAGRLASLPEGEEAARVARLRFGPERGAAVAALLGALLFAAVALLGLRQS